MDDDQFINDALELRQQPDDRLAAWVWVVGQAEVLTDIEGIDTFIDLHADRLPLAVKAFEAIGASEIASALGSLLAASDDREATLDVLNKLISSRTGYDYEAIRALVARTRSPRATSP